MNIVKNLLLPIILLGLLTTVSCNKSDDEDGGGDLCANVDCGTYGGCSEGICLCQAGYGTGSDGKCSQANRDKFLGAFTGTDGCTAATGVTITEGNDGISSIKITYNFADSVNNSIVITGYVSEGASALLYGGTATINGQQVTYTGTSVSIDEDEVYVSFDAEINGTDRECNFAGTR